MAKKKKKDIQTILLKAEKLYQRSNFILAEKEFKKVQKKLQSAEIAKKIKICHRESEIIRAKGLVKHGQKAIKKNDIDKAVTCFEEAGQILDESWIHEKISQLKELLQVHDADAEAKEAQASGDYLGAAKLYEEASLIGEKKELLLKSASCLVRSQQFSKAAAMYQDLPVTDDSDIYDHGFALTKTGHHIEALKIWDNLKTKDTKFLDQKKAIFTLACSQVYTRLEKKDSLDEISIDADYILSKANALGNKHQIAVLEKLSKVCRYTRLEMLWKKEAFESVEKLLKTMDFVNKPPLIALNAKTYLKLAQQDRRYLKPLINFWLTAVYSREISRRFSKNPDKREQIQKHLLTMAEDLVNQYSGTEESSQAAIYLDIEKKLIQDLFKITQEKEVSSNLICTPRYAADFGLSDKILQLIRDNRHYFKNNQHYLETGGYYSKIWESLYLIKAGELDKALSMLGDLNAEEKKDEFIQYASGLVRFEFGKACIEKKDKNFLQYFDSAPLLFEMAPSYEKKFTKSIHDIEDGLELIPYIEVLTAIYKTRASDAIAQALSIAITLSAIDRRNLGQITNKNVNVALTKALKLYPENELARETMNDVIIEREIETIYKAMSKHKLGKASKIALETEYTEVEDMYFNFIEQLVDQIKDNELDQNMQTRFLQDMFDWCSTVDSNHPVLDRIHRMLDA